MPLSIKPFHTWDEDDISALIEEPEATESVRLDFKADCKLLSSDASKKEKARRDILIDISAMANGVGGTLLFGVRQTGDPDEPPKAVKIEGIREIERLKETIESLVHSHLDVRPGQIEYHTIPWKNDRPVLILEIPANTYCLSMVTYKDTNQFWIRRGTDNRPMATDEIEYKFGQFAKIRDSAIDLLASLRSQLRPSNATPLVWFAGIPISRWRDSIPVNISAIKQMIDASSYFVEYRRDRTVSCTPHSYSGDLVPCVRGVGLSAARRSRDVFLELQREGIVIFRHDLGLTTSEDKEQIDLWEIYEPIISCLYLFREIQDRFGVTKNAVVQSGLFYVNNKRIAYFPPYNDCWPQPFVDKHIILDPLILDEHWDPKAIFSVWAVQIGNALGQEEALVLPPWIVG